MKIDAMIAGAQKAGTSSLKFYLSQHPAISTHTNLECDVFSSDQADFESYRRKFFEPEADIVLAKYAHLYKEEAFVARLRDHNPHCKILFIIREPVARLRSAYIMGKKDWIEHSGDYFQVALEKHERNEYDVAYNTLVKLGDYGRAADVLYRYFPPQQVKFVSFTGLGANPVAVVRELAGFLGVDADFTFDTGVQNAATAERSRGLSRAILALKRSPVTRAVRGVLPYPVFHAIKTSIEKANSVPPAPETAPIWSADTEAALRVYYAGCNQRFDERTGLSIESLF